MQLLTKTFQSRPAESSSEQEKNVHDVGRDVDVVVWSLSLHNIRRYFHQRFWEEETRASEFAKKIEPHPRLESVSEHSWHIAFISNLLAARFSWLQQPRVLQLALLHDILEIILGDQSPIGRDGTGMKTHAFNERIAQERARSEEVAIERYVRLLPEDAQISQRELLNDYTYGRTQEALFVKSVDKLQTLAYVLLKKRGDMEDRHIHFTLRYSEKGVSFFPPLEDHFRELQRRLLASVANERSITEAELRGRLFGGQLSLW